jgi:hypothetical protein
VFFSPSSQVASHYADLGGIRGVKAGETPHGVHDIPYGLADRPGETFYKHEPYVYDGSQVYPAVVNPGKQKVVEIPYYNTAEVDAVVKQARQQGYDTLRIKGMADTGGGATGSRADQIVVLNLSSRSGQAAIMRYDDTSIFSPDTYHSAILAALRQSAASQDARYLDMLATMNGMKKPIPNLQSGIVNRLPDAPFGYTGPHGIAPDHCPYRRLRITCRPRPCWYTLPIRLPTVRPSILATRSPIPPVAR